MFDADLSKTGDLLTTTTKYRNDNGEPFDITEYLIKKNYLSTLHWVPRIWDVGGTVQPFVLAPNSLPYIVNKFIIYVNDKVGFWCNFEALKTSWKGTADDITKVAVDKDDPYLASLLAACIISHVGGISRKHLKGDNKVITSIARYYIYYHMKRFTEDPRKMNSYITDDIQELIKANLQTKTTWVNKFVRTRENIILWYQQHPNMHNIRNYKYRMSRNHTGVLGLDYQEVFRVENNSDSDWMCFNKEDSDGLTKTGQRLFQLAVEFYVYCVLGAQPQTVVHRVPRSEIVADTRNLPQVGKRHYNPRRSCKSHLRYETCQKNTNVVLNMAITPGIILLPSDMIILKELVVGYNNVLTLTTRDMKFSVNEDINYVEPAKTSGTQGSQNGPLDASPTTTTQGGGESLPPEFQPQRCFPRLITKPYTYL